MDAPIDRTYVREYRLKICSDCSAEFQTTGHNAKRCTACLRVRDAAANKAYRDKHKERLAAQTKAKREANPEAARAAERRRKDARGKDREAEYQRRYKEKNRVMMSVRRRGRARGVPPHVLLEMLSAQGNRCAVCLTALAVDAKWCVDHCHKTGVVRGILCGSCNTGIGMLRDDPELCDMAAIYLRT